MKKKNRRTPQLTTPERIRRAYSQWAKELIPRPTYIRWAADFAYYGGHKPTIEISPVAVTENANVIGGYLRQNFKLEFPLYRLEYYTWCFLHEVGHHYTYRFIPESERHLPDPTDAIQYRKMPAELAADRWAIAYLNKHWDRVEWWQDKLTYLYEEATTEELNKLLEEVLKDAAE